MKKGTPRLSSLGRALAMLKAVLQDDGASSISAIARRLDMPLATAHRQIASLVDAGYLAPAISGRYIAGSELTHLSYLFDPKKTIAALVRPLIGELAEGLGTVVHLGSFEGDMVTYRAKAGRADTQVFTEVGGQLEAYCSGIGKVLLAHLPAEDLRSYLANGPFVALTENTITDPVALRKELDWIRSSGFSLDRAEIEEGLHCVAAPISAPDGTVPLALSASFRNLVNDDQLAEAAVQVRATCKAIERRLWQHSIPIGPNRTG